MKLIIAAGRDYQFSHWDSQALAKLHEEHPIAEVVGGEETACGEEWARKRGIPVRVFPAEWAKHGKAAGPIRNRQMAEYADAIALFPGGPADTSKAAAEVGLTLFDYRLLSSKFVGAALGPQSFGSRVRRGFAFCAPLWGIFCLIPAVTGRWEVVIGRLVGGAFWLVIGVLVWAGIASGMARLRTDRASDT